MNKIKSLDDLRRVKKDLVSGTNRNLSNSPESLVQVRVAMATCSIAAGAREVYNAFAQSISLGKLNAALLQGGCMGYCYAEPTVEVRKPGNEPVIFSFVSPAFVDEIIEKYISKGEQIDGILPINFQTVK